MQEKNRITYYLVGRGHGDLAASNWNEKEALSGLTMNQASIGNTEIYTVTVQLCAGDAFQICHGGAWEGQIGFGFMEGAAFCSGVNPCDGIAYETADQKIACVKDSDGNAVFYGYNEFYTGYKTWNITLADGMDGRYRFTYISHPMAPSFNRLLWERLTP